MDDKLKKWISALKRRDKIFRLAVLDNEAEIIDANTAQLEGGKDAFGNFLEEYTTDAYAEFKQALGSKAPFKIADLKLEGNFYAGFDLISEGMTIFRITSTDEKRDKLVSEWGEDIFGLNEDSLKEIRPLVLESFLTLLRKEVA